MEDQVTNQKVGEIWADDLLGRETEANTIVRFLLSRIDERHDRGETRSYVLNIDSKWGQGKTFFLTRLRLQLKAEGFVVSYVNAWADDHADDPLIAVMAALEASLNPLLKLNRSSSARKAWNKTRKHALKLAVIVARSGAKAFARKWIGEGFEEIRSVINTSQSDGGGVIEDSKSYTQKDVDRLFDDMAKESVNEFQVGKRAISDFKKNAESLIQALPNKVIFVLIDELDRCRPPYAISLLERVKHLFEIDGFVFIVATDTSELKHSVSAVYGQNFGGGAYLRRFFDRVFQFSGPDLDVYVKSLVSKYRIAESPMVSIPPVIEMDEFLVGIFTKYNITLRDIDQCFDIIRSCLSVWDAETQLELVYLIPLVIMFQQGNEEAFAALVAGNIAPLHTLAKRKFSIRMPDPQDRFRSTYIPVEFEQFLSDLCIGLTKPLSDLTGNRTGSPSRLWAASRFEHEYLRLHGNSYQSGSPPMSVLQQYPSLVRSAGQIARA